MDTDAYFSHVFQVCMVCDMGACSLVTCTHSLWRHCVWSYTHSLWGHCVWAVTDNLHTLTVDSLITNTSASATSASSTAAASQGRQGSTVAATLGAAAASHDRCIVMTPQTQTATSEMAVLPDICTTPILGNLREPLGTLLVKLCLMHERQHVTLR